MGYKRWRPNSRRNRRRAGSRRGAAQGANKTFFVVAGLFILAILLLLGALALFTS
ncbi:MAG: hypothetical protein LC781_10515 [Actinobacteria bacterium]|nr:hypothetical protein [Actinomycetota bacterium]